MSKQDAVKQTAVEEREPDFEQVTSMATGGMPAANYRDLYHVALSAGKGTVVEIGSAQGGGTVALGLAAKRNPNIERIITIDAFCNSASLKYPGDIEGNIRVLQEHLERFDCAALITIMTAGQEDWDLINSSPLSMLVIDADGRLDRDFSNYYNLLVDGAPVFVDDCAFILNNLAKTYYTRERTGWSDDPVADAGPYFEKAIPLGKDWMTKCHVDYMVREGLLEEVACRKKTVTLKKVPGARPFSEHDVARMGQIQIEMRDRLLAMRAKTMEIARELEPVLRQISAQTLCEEVVVFGSVERNSGTRFYPIYGVGKDGKKAAEVMKFNAGQAREDAVDGDELVFLKMGWRKPARHALLLRKGEGAGGGKLSSGLKRQLKQTIAVVDEKTANYFDSLKLETLQPRDAGSTQ